MNRTRVRAARRDTRAPRAFAAIAAALAAGSLTGVPAPAQAAASYSESCAAVATSVTLSNAADVKLSGAVTESWTNPNWAFTNFSQSASRGTASFAISIWDEAKAGDQFSLRASDIGIFIGAPANLKDAVTNETIATAKLDGSQGIVFTLTNYVDSHTNVTTLFKQTYGFSSAMATATGGVLTPGKTYTPTFQACDGEKSASFNVSTAEQYNSTGLRTGWRGDQDVARLNIVYNGVPATSATDLHTITIDIDRPGTKFDCAQLDNTTSPYGIGYGVWDGKLMMEAPIGTKVEGPPGPGQFRVLSCSDREVQIEWMPSAAGETFRTQLATVPDGTTGWELLGDKPFTITLREESDAGVVTRTGVPVRPSSGEESGGISFTDPVVTKSRNAEGNFVLTVTNPTADKVVRAQTYTDALYTAADELAEEQLEISNPSLGTVALNQWTLPMLAPGESATALVKFDEKQLEPGGSVRNRFGVEGSECVTGVPDQSELGPQCGEVIVTRPPATGSVSWEKVGPTGTHLSGSEWEISLAEDEKITVVDNGSNDQDPRSGFLLVDGLQQGPHTLVETKAPDGFKLGKESIDFSIEQDALHLALEPVVNQPVVAVTNPPTSQPAPTQTVPPENALSTTGGADYGPIVALGGALSLLGAVAFGSAKLRRRPRSHC